MKVASYKKNVSKNFFSKSVVNDFALTSFPNKLKLIKQAFHVKREERKQILWIKLNANPGPKGSKPIWK